MTEYYGSIRITNPSTLQSWIDKGWYAEQLKQGYNFYVGCGRFRQDKCTCTKCRNYKNNKLRNVLKNNNLEIS